AELTGQSPAQVQLSLQLSKLVVRPQDFLIMRLFFLNLKRGWFWGDLHRINRHAPAYIFAQLRQQHVAQHVHDINETAVPSPAGTPAPCSTCVFDYASSHITPDTLFSPSLVPGFSYFTLRIPEHQRSIPIEAKALLDWLAMDVMGWNSLSPSVGASGNISGPGPLGNIIGNWNPTPLDPSQYPLSLATNNLPSYLYMNDGHAQLPVTLIEAPYKLYLSPSYPDITPAPGPPPLLRHFFKGDNSPQQYWEDIRKEGVLRLFEYWNNQLQTQVGNTINQPQLKVVAYNDSPENPAVNLIPPGSSKANLAKLTNLNQPNRQIATDFLYISSLGISSFYHYWNIDDANTRLIGYDHHIEQGRDNFESVTVKALDLRSGLRLSVTTIGQRTVTDGDSFLYQRFKFDYLDTSVDFGQSPKRINDILFRQIRVDQTALAAKAEDTADKKKSTGTYFAVLKCLNNLCNIPASFAVIPGIECSADPYPLRLLKMPYIGTDVNGKDHPFEMDLCLVEKGVFNDPAQVTAVVMALNALLADAVNGPYHSIQFKKELIGYAPGTGNQTQFATDEVQFYPTIADQYEAATPPVLPKLKYAQLYITQLQGIEATPTPQIVSYQNDYAAHGFDIGGNPTQLFLQILDTCSKIVPITATLPTDPVGLDAHRAPIQNVFSQNYRSAGQFVDPGIVISDISSKVNSLTLSGFMNKYAGIDPNNIQLPPIQLLRGVQVQIMGGLSLTSILQQLIPLDQSPVFQTIQNAVD
ncbi:MAG TPA: hypothetical protein VKR41_08220, partial [Puia sp.]|nr:hypothetical protein [Puia sp.]